MTLIKNPDTKRRKKFSRRQITALLENHPLSLTLLLSTSRLRENGFLTHLGPLALSQAVRRNSLYLWCQAANGLQPKWSRSISRKAKRFQPSLMKRVMAFGLRPRPVLRTGRGLQPARLVASLLLRTSNLNNALVATRYCECSHLFDPLVIVLTKWFFSSQRQILLPWSSKGKYSTLCTVQLMLMTSGVGALESISQETMHSPICFLGRMLVEGDNFLRER